MYTDNPHNRSTDLPKHQAWEMGWSAGYDDCEADWVKRTLPIVGELEESIRYDWENNDCVQVDKLKIIFDAFWPFAPEHDWLEPLIKDAVKIQNEARWDLSRGEWLDLQVMARAFGLEVLD